MRPEDFAYLDAETRVGAYTESQGLSIVRQEVADFITARDGVPAVKENVFLTDGASKGVEFLLKLVLRGKDDGVLVPIPQYPLYSAALALAQASTCCPRPRPRPRARVQTHCP